MMADDNSRSCWACLPEEVQQEILLRLPCKSLIRFESVCKKWLDMLHSRGFIDLYGRRGQLMSDPNFLQSTSYATISKMFPGLIIDETWFSEINERDDDVNWESMISVLGPLNGIYCLAYHYHEGVSGRDQLILSAKIGLCNPATHQYRVTNPFPRKFHSRLSNLPESSCCSLHFGFGHVENNYTMSLDYRVVLLIEHGGHPNSTPSFLVFVYSMQTGAWKRIVDYEPGTRNYGKRKATDAFNIQGRQILHIEYPLEGCPQRFFEGCYYWMATVTAGQSRRHWDVLSFNFAHQSFQLIGGPPLYESTYVVTNREVVAPRSQVFLLHGHLAVIQCYDVLPSIDRYWVRRTHEVVVWMMMEYGVQESWTRIHTITRNFDTAWAMCLYGIRYHPPLRSGGGICIQSLLFGNSNFRLISCEGDGDGGYQVDIGDSNDHMCWNFPGISTYVETLERL